MAGLLLAFARQGYLMQNFFDPATLFFVFGVIAVALGSNLEIPPAIAKFISLSFLMALGLKGGFALSDSGLSGEIVLSLFIAVAMSFIVPPGPATRDSRGSRPVIGSPDSRPCPTA